MAHYRRGTNELARGDTEYGSAILTRVIEADASAITADLARYSLSMQLPPADEERVNELSANTGSDAIARKKADWSAQ